MSESPAALLTPALLQVEHLTMRFGGLVAIDDLSFEAARGEITAIIGPNGAGKTTVFNCITGFYKPTSGRMLLFGFAMVLIMVWRPRGLIATREPSTFLNARRALPSRASQSEETRASLVRERHG